MTATRQEVMTNYERETMTGVSTQEEEDTVMNYHAVKVTRNGMNVHKYSQDTDVLLQAVRRTPLLGSHAALIMGTGERRRKVFQQSIYDKLGPEKSAAFINWNAFTCCDTTGHIHGKGKNGCFATFLKASPNIFIALPDLGKGDEPSEETVCGCEEFLCFLFCLGRVHIKQANMLRWFVFKQS